MPFFRRDHGTHCEGCDLLDCSALTVLIVVIALPQTVDDAQVRPFNLHNRYKSVAHIFYQQRTTCHLMEPDCDVRPGSEHCTFVSVEIVDCSVRTKYISCH